MTALSFSMALWPLFEVEQSLADEPTMSLGKKKCLNSLMEFLLVWVTRLLGKDQISTKYSRHVDQNEVVSLLVTVDLMPLLSQYEGSLSTVRDLSCSYTFS